jgi:hypothetical protein
MRPMQLAKALAMAVLLTLGAVHAADALLAQAQVSACCTRATWVGSWWLSGQSDVNHWQNTRVLGSKDAVLKTRRRRPGMLSWPTPACMAAAT